MTTNNNDLDFQSMSDVVERFLTELRNANSKEFVSYSGKLGLVLSNICQSRLSSPDKNEFFRKLAFTLFQRPEGSSFYKIHNRWLPLLRIATFHNFDDATITAKIFLKAYSSLFQDNTKERKESLSDSVYNSIYQMFHGIRPIRQPYTNFEDNTVTRVELGTGKYFFDLFSQGLSNGYKLNDYKSTGIFVTPWNDKLIPEQSRLRRSFFYADRSATEAFDCPVRVVLDVPNKYLCRAWLKNANHANSYELSIVKEDLEAIIKGGLVHGEVYDYTPFKVALSWDPQLENLAENLNVTPDQVALFSRFVEEKQYQYITLPPREPVAFTFGQSTLGTDESDVSDSISLHK